MSKQEHMNFKQALIAHLNGDAVEMHRGDGKWLSFIDECGHYAIGEIDPKVGSACTFRIKPRTVTVNGVKCVAPEAVEPKFGTRAWIAHPAGENWAIWAEWIGTTLQKDLFLRGLIFLCEEHAVAYAKAMCNYKDGEK